MKSHKLTAGLLILLFAVCSQALFAGGGQPSGTGEAKKDVMSVMVVDEGRPKWSKGMELWTVAKTASIADIIIDIQPIPRDVYQTKYATTVASSSIPDIIQSYHPDMEKMINEYGMKGKFVAVDMVMDKMPNVKKHLTAFKDQWKLIDADDGHIYHLPNIHPYQNHEGWGGLVARVDWLKEAGVDYQNLKSVDDFFNLLLTLQQRQMKENGIKAILGSRYGALGVFHMAKIFGTQTGYEGPVYWDSEANTYTSAVKHPDNMKDFLRFLERMSDAEMFDPDYLTMPDATWDPSLGEGHWPFCLESEGWISRLNRDVSKALGYSETKHIWGFVIPPPYKGKVQPWRFEGSRHLYYGWTISANPQCPLEKIYKTWDWTYSDEGALAWYMGKEGVTYKVEPSGQIRLLVWPWDAEGGGMKTFYEEVGATHNWMFPTNPYKLNYNMASPDGYDSYPKDQLEIWKQKVPMPGPPVQTFTGDERDETKQIAGAIFTATSELLGKVIIGEATADDYDDVVAFANKNGIDRLLELYNMQHKRFYGN